MSRSETKQFNRRVANLALYMAKDVMKKAIQLEGQKSSHFKETDITRIAKAEAIFYMGAATSAVKYYDQLEHLTLVIETPPLKRPNRRETT